MVYENVTIMRTFFMKVGKKASKVGCLMDYLFIFNKHHVGSGLVLINHLNSFQHLHGSLRLLFQSHQ
jgi:hypothetical protein